MPSPAGPRRSTARSRPASHSPGGASSSTSASRSGTSSSSRGTRSTNRRSGPRAIGRKTTPPPILRLGTRVSPRSNGTGRKWSGSSSIARPIFSPRFRTGRDRRCCGRRCWSRTTRPITWASWCCCEGYWGSTRASLACGLSLLQPLNRELESDQRRVEPLAGVVVERRVGGAEHHSDHLERAAHQVRRGLLLRAPVHGLALPPPSAPPVLELPPFALEQPQQEAARPAAAAAFGSVAPLFLGPAVVGHGGCQPLTNFTTANTNATVVAAWAIQKENIRFVNRVSSWARRRSRVASDLANPACISARSSAMRCSSFASNREKLSSFSSRRSDRYVASTKLNHSTSSLVTSSPSLS